MTTNSLFQPLPRIKTGIRALEIDSERRIATFRVQMEETAPRPIQIRRRGRSSRSVKGPSLLSKRK